MCHTPQQQNHDFNKQWLRAASLTPAFQPASRLVFLHLDDVQLALCAGLTQPKVATPFVASSVHATLPVSLVIIR